AGRQRSSRKRLTASRTAVQAVRDRHHRNTVVLYLLMEADPAQTGSIDPIDGLQAETYRLSGELDEIPGELFNAALKLLRLPVQGAMRRYLQRYRAALFDGPGLQRIGAIDGGITAPTAAEALEIACRFSFVRIGTARRRRRRFGVPKHEHGIVRLLRAQPLGEGQRFLVRQDLR